MGALLQNRVSKTHRFQVPFCSFEEFATLVREQMMATAEAEEENIRPTDRDFIDNLKKVEINE